MTDRVYGVKLNLEGNGAFISGVAGSEAALAKMATTATSTAGKVDQVGMSTKQMAAAMRGVPAQITDIVTSLQGGQAPLTVFLQQGGQLRDMFGGIAPAAKALGSAVLSMITPMTAGAAAIGALGIAAYKGAQEQAALRDALILSGNAAGMTMGRFDAMASSVAANSGQTIGSAKEIAQALVSSGKIGRDAFDTVSLASARYADVSGQTAAKAAEHFAGMGSGVAAWAAENNKAWNFITLDIYKQIKALEDRGEAQAAMVIAGKAFIEHVGEERRNLGYLETAVEGVSKALSTMKTWLLSLGKDSNLTDQFQSQAERVRDAAVSLAEAQKNGRLKGVIDERKEFLQQQQQILQQIGQRMQAEDHAAKARAAQAAADRKAIDDQIEADKKADAARRAAQAARIKSAREAAQEQERQNQLVLESAGLASDFTEKWNRLIVVFKDVNKVYADGETGYDKLTAAQKRLLDQQPAVKKAAEEEAASIKSAMKVATDRAAMRAAEQKAIDEFGEKEDARRNAEVKSAQDALKAAQLEYDQHGKTRSQIAELTLQRLRDKQAAFQVGSANYESVQKEIDAQRELISVLQRGEIRTANEEAAKASAEAWNAFYGDLNRGMTDALYRAFESGEGFAEAFFKTLRNTAKTTVLKIGVQAVTSAAGSYVSDAFGLSSGGGGAGLLGAANTGSSLLNLGTAAGSIWGSSAAYGAALGTTSIGAGSQAAMLASQTGVFGPAGVGATAAAAGGTAGTAMSTIAAAAPYIAAVLAVYALAEKYTKGETRSGGQYGFGVTPNGTFGSSATFLSGPSGGQISGDQVTTAINSTVAGINATLKAVGSAATLTGFQAALESSGNGRGGVYAGGTLSTGATFGELGLGGGRSNYNGTLYETTSATTLDSATALKNFSTDLMQATIQALQAATDIPKTISDMLKGVDAEALSAEAASALIANVNAMAAFTKAAGALPFTQLHDLSFEAANGLIQLVGGMDALGSQLGTYYDAYYTEAERQGQAVKNLQGVFSSLGLTMPSLTQSGESARAQFRQLVEAQDLNTESGRAAYAALLGVSGAFAELAPIGVEVAATVDEVTGEIKTLSQVMLDLGREHASLQDQYDRLTLSQADYRAKTIAGYTEEERAAAAANFALADQIAMLQEVARLDQQRTAMENQLLQVQGDTATLRARELAALPESLRALQERIFLLTDEAAAAQEATRLAQEQAQQRAAMSQQLAGLEIQLLQAQGNTAEIRRRELAALPAEAQAIQQLIYARQDEVTAASEAAAAIQQAAQQKAALDQQLASLEVQLLQLQGNTVEIRRRELAALPEQARAIQELIYARQDEVAAATAASAAIQAAAQRAEAILQQRTGLETQWLQLIGDTATLRQRELAALDPSNRALQEAIWARQDQIAADQAAAAASEEAARQAEATAQAQIQSAQEAARAIEQALQAVAAERLGLTKRLLQLQGDTAALRAMELAELDPSNRALQQQIWALEDQQAALSNATSAQDTYSNAVADSSSTLLDAGRTIAEFFARLRGTAAGGASAGSQIASARNQFEAQYALARGGNAEALSGITGYAERYIEAMRSTAGSALDVQRLVGILEGRLTGLTGGGMSTITPVSPALSQVSPVPMAAAGEASAAAMMMAPTGSVPSFGSQGDAQMVAELRALRAEVANLRRESQATAVNTGRTARLFDRIERDGLGIRNAPGETLEVVT